jgi:hypothetical protein
LYSLANVAFSSSQDMDVRKLEFPVHELRILAARFQFVIDRRKKLAHPTARLNAGTPEVPSKAFAQLWHKVTFGHRVCNELRAVLRQSEQDSQDQFRSRHEDRDANTSSPAGPSVTKRLNLVNSHNNEILNGGTHHSRPDERYAYSSSPPASSVTHQRRNFALPPRYEVRNGGALQPGHDKRYAYASSPPVCQFRSQ